ncbi:MAG TPA: hypothetical protein VFB07_11245 [Vicinamibacterales bacterium]|nr:hypothetical protein [Vicinamibacterales bacterium]
MRLVAAAALLFALAAAAADQPAAAFVVGALRRDGAVVPFAAFDGKHWSSPWPLPRLERPIPINLNSIPKSWWGKAGPRETWQAWIDGAAQTLQVRQPDWVAVHCTRQVALRTDYHPAEPPPPPTAQPFPKDGLAVSPPHALEPIAILSPGATELLPLGPTLYDAFNDAERETASRYSDPMPQKQREKYDPGIEAAYAYGTDPRTYYVESSRAYRSPGGDGCAIAFGTGWIVKRGETYTAVATTVDIVPCDRYGATYMLPFGVMTLNGHTYWLAQFSGWAHERFVVVDLKPKEVEAVVNVWGGGC